MFKPDVSYPCHRGNREPIHRTSCARTSFCVRYAMLLVLSKGDTRNSMIRILCTTRCAIYSRRPPLISSLSSPCIFKKTVNIERSASSKAKGSPPYSEAQCRSVVRLLSAALWTRQGCGPAVPHARLLAGKRRKTTKRQVMADRSVSAVVLSNEPSRKTDKPRRHAE